MAGVLCFSRRIGCRTSETCAQECSLKGQLVSVGDGAGSGLAKAESGGGSGRYKEKYLRLGGLDSLESL